MDRLSEELARTAYQKKAVSKLPPAAVLELAMAFFAEQGYRVGRTGRPGQVFVMGKAEGALPRVTGEVAARADVGKPGTTLVTMDAAGERLGPAMAEFHKLLRERGRGPGAKPAPASGPRPGPARRGTGGARAVAAGEPDAADPGRGDGVPPGPSEAADRRP